MKLRDHPLMTRKSGMKTWPPLWVNIQEAKDKPRGEIGTLMRVQVADAIRNALFLTIEHNDREYAGAMYFDDPSFCAEIHRVLEAKIGVSMSAIGNVDLSYTL